MASHAPRHRHRHSADADAALELLQTLAQQATRPGVQGVIANLESHGWIYHGEKAGVRIFSNEADGDGDSAGLEREGSQATAPSTAGTGIEGRPKAKQGIRAHETLPFFRGEAFLEGSWRPDDVAAVIRSFGARAVWDPRFDSLRSSVVESLSSTDALAHLHIRGTFPVGARDAAFVSTDVADDDSCTWVAARSVEDALIPKKGTRTTIHLNGYCIRAASHSPYFEPPPQSSPDETTAPVRPAHRRSKSSISGLPGLGMPPVPLSSSMPTLTKRPSYNFPSSAPPPRPPSLAPSMRQRSSSSASSIHGHQTRHASYGTQPNVPPFEYALSKGDPSAATAIAVSRLPGVFVSFIARSSPGGNLPQTYVNQLSLSLPLGLSHINQYLHAHGFPPHIERSSRQPGLDVLSESYDVAGGLYNLVYRVAAPLAASTTRIRFFGSAFSRGNFSIEVFRARGWTIEYDVEPDEPPEVTREDDADDANDARSRRRTSISILTTPSTPTPRRVSRPPNFSFPHRPRMSIVVDAPDVLDSAKLAGPAGGCTLVIPNGAAAGCMPVQVCISKNPEAARATMDSMMLGGALGRAASVALESTHSDSIEQLLGSETGEAEMALHGARTVLRQLRKEREEDARARCGKAASRSVSIATTSGGALGLVGT